MTLIDRLRPVLLRWDNALALAAVALPFVLAMLAGILWLAERGWLLSFIGGSIGLSGVVALVRFLARRARVARAADPSEPMEAAHVGIDPEWTAAEREAFTAAREFIARSVKSPRPWSDLQPLALDVIDLVARQSGKKGKGRLDFTVPEALLLIERVATRFRADIRDYVPMADAVSVAALETVWRHRETLRKGLRAGHFAWRAARAIKSLPTAILREIESAIAQGHTNAVSGEGMAVLQVILLEEVAAAAVDLYSGRLRFSDSELLALQRASGDIDAARLADDDAAVRIAVAGQVSAGKSTVVNALLGADMAETDVVATTDQPTSYDVAWGDVACVLLDMPGLDGTGRSADAVLAELVDCDLVVWVARANRPARDIDRRVLHRLCEHFADRPERRAPPIVPVATGIDMLIADWPYPENLLPPDALAAVSGMVKTIAADIGTENPVPVALSHPLWNVEALRAAVENHLMEALMVQRNRVRTTKARTGLRTEISRAGKGVVKGISTLGPRLLRSRDTGPE